MKLQKMILRESYPHWVWENIHWAPAYFVPDGDNVTPLWSHEWLWAYSQVCFPSLCAAAFLASCQRCELDWVIQTGSNTTSKEVKQDRRDNLEAMNNGLHRNHPGPASRSTHQQPSQYQNLTRKVLVRNHDPGVRQACWRVTQWRRVRGLSGGDARESCGSVRSEAPTSCCMGCAGGHGPRPSWPQQRVEIPAKIQEDSGKVMMPSSGEQSAGLGLCN